jgi:hypothetical protein
MATDDDFIFLAKKLREALNAAERATVTLTVVISPERIQVFLGDGRGQHWRKSDQLNGVAKRESVR